MTLLYAFRHSNNPASTACQPVFLPADDPAVYNLTIHFSFIERLPASTILTACLPSQPVTAVSVSLSIASANAMSSARYASSKSTIQLLINGVEVPLSTVVHLTKLASDLPTCRTPFVPTISIFESYPYWTYAA